MLGETEREACEQLARAADTNFEGVHRFIPAAYEPRLLALEALFRSLRDVPLSVSDPSVGLAKLGWWQQELARARTEGSQHPVVRALIQTGVLEQLDQDQFNAYLHALMMQLQEDCLDNVAMLESSLRDTAGNEAGILIGSAAPEACVAAACAARMLELMRTLAGTHSEHGWLPMDLVARHSLSRSTAGSAESRAALVADLAGQAGQMRESAPVESAGGKGAGGAYIVLRDSLVGKRLARAMADPAAFLAGTQGPGFGEVFATWNTARRLVRDARWET